MIVKFICDEPAFRFTTDDIYYEHCSLLPCVDTPRIKAITTVPT